MHELPEVDIRARRILMAVPQFPPPIVGGLEKQAHELAAELVRLGHKVSVLSGRVFPGQPAVECVDGLKVYRVLWPSNRYVRWIVMPFVLALAFARLAKKVDLVHIHVISGFGLFILLLAGWYQLPALVKIAAVGKESVPGLKPGWVSWLRFRIFRRADAVVAMSKQSFSELVSSGYPATRILLTPNGINLWPETKPDIMRPRCACRLVFVGRLHAEKGLEDLLSALRLAVDQVSGVDISLDVIGDGDELANLEASIERLQLNKLVQLRGHLPDVPARLQEYDALVLPSYGEGNSNVILEAMAAGLPVISTKVGGTPMQVGPRGLELLHNPRDVAELARLIMHVAANPDKREQIGRTMRIRAETYFDIRRVAATYSQSYELLATSRRQLMERLANPVVCGESPSSDQLG